MPTSVRTVCGFQKLGFDSSRMTLVSSCENPPCSSCFLRAAGVGDADVRGHDDVRRARVDVLGSL